MSEEKLELLCNGINSIAEATGVSFEEVLDDLECAMIITEEQKSEVIQYMANQ